MKNKGLSDSQIAQSLYQAMKKDKKNSSSKVKFVLQEDIGETVITEIEEKDILAVLTGSN